MKAYYNEFEKYPAQWLHNLMDAGEIAPGVVDERDIRDVTPEELLRYDRCHFFAGIAGWDYALRLAGWPEEWPVWTGSCPCQPFSTAGGRGGGADERHLWPYWFWLIRQCRPPIIFGEQVASKDGLKWLDVVFSDLEAEGYSCGAVDLPACSVGAPHIRQRLWFVAIASEQRPQRFRKYEGPEEGNQSGRTSKPGSLGDSKECGSGARFCDCGQGEERRTEPSDPSPTSILVHANLPESEWRAIQGYDKADLQIHESEAKQRPDRPSPTRKLADSASQQNNQKQQKPKAAKREWGSNSIGRCGMANPWRDVIWLPCRDGKARPTQPGVLPLAHGVPNRVGRLRAYGNAIVSQVAALFIRTVMDFLKTRRSIQ